jgi:hypothetical protein
MGSLLLQRKGPATPRRGALGGGRDEKVAFLVLMAGNGI